MAITIKPEPNFTGKLDHQPGNPVPKFVPGEKYRNNERYFFIENVTWSTAGYIISVDLLELSNRKLITVLYQEMKKLVAEMKMVEWVPEN